MWDAAGVLRALSSPCAESSQPLHPTQTLKDNYHWPKAASIQSSCIPQHPPAGPGPLRRPWSLWGEELPQGLSALAQPPTGWRAWLCPRSFLHPNFSTCQMQGAWAEGIPSGHPDADLLGSLSLSCGPWNH